MPSGLLSTNVTQSANAAPRTAPKSSASSKDDGVSRFDEMLDEQRQRPAAHDDERSARRKAAEHADRTADATPRKTVKSAKAKPHPHHKPAAATEDDESDRPGAARRADRNKLPTDDAGDEEPSPDHAAPAAEDGEKPKRHIDAHAIDSTRVAAQPERTLAPTNDDEPADGHDAEGTSGTSAATLPARPGAQDAKKHEDGDEPAKVDLPASATAAAPDATAQAAASGQQAATLASAALQSGAPPTVPGVKPHGGKWRGDMPIAASGPVTGATNIAAGMTAVDAVVDDAGVADADALPDGSTASTDGPSPDPSAPRAFTEMLAAAQVQSPSAHPPDKAGAKEFTVAAPPAPPEAKFADTNHGHIVSGVAGQLLPNGGSMQIRLDPAELGTLHVRVELRDGVMTASFETQNDQATRLLSHSLGQLRTALESQGMNVDRLHVQQAPRGSSSSNAGSQGEGRRPSDQPFQDSSSHQEQQRREMLRRMWRRLSGGSDPLDLVA